MTSGSPSRPNSLLNMLNPYASVNRSTYSSTPRSEPDSPSTMLLRELQGGTDHGQADVTGDDRQRMSPTPTISTSPAVRRPTHVIATPTSSDDEEAPPRSLIFGEQLAPGERTPRSPPSALPSRQTQPFAQSSSSRPRADSPGPFRASAAPSSSPSGAGSQSQSRSTSPGPSSLYASGMDLTRGAQSSALPASTYTSRDPSTSPERASTRLPTFREPPAVVRPSPPRRVSSTKKAVALVEGVRHDSRAGYLDPGLASPVAGPSRPRDKGKARQKGGRKYQSVPAHDEEEADHARGIGRRAAAGKTGLSDYDRALWKWVNVEDLDRFLQEVYDYYKGKGIWCIVLARVLNLLTTFFVIAFSTFLTSCIDYSKLRSTTSGPEAIARLDDVLIPQCIARPSAPHWLFILTVSGFYLFQLTSFALSIPRLLEMYRFYTHLLGIPDGDIQTLPWPEIVRLIGEIRKHNPVTSLSNGQADALAGMVGDEANKETVKKLDAHDVANRILRQENYLIALFNKELLDLRVRLPVPHVLDHHIPTNLLAPGSQTILPSHAGFAPRKYISFGANTLTRALEWNLRFCLMAYLFDPRGQVRKEFIRERRRKDLIEGLRRRFIFMGVLNAIFAPFIVMYLLMYSFFRYFEEYHKNPSSIGSRQYTPYAQWKFREFNELPHLFERRLDRSYPVAKEYIDQFPKERTALVMRFVAFVAGSFAAVLLVASLIDPDLFLRFEITPHRTVLFYLGLFGSVLALARGMVPEENMVFDPEANLRDVVRWTHYLPVEWRGKLHSQMVHKEFGTLFALKITIFFTELMSVILTPFILFFSLPPCAGAIIDFFREFTVHVDGVGYVCSFAVFDFRLHGDSKPAEESEGGSHDTGHGDTPVVPRKGMDWRANENKMEKSFLHFKATHPDWQPTDPSSSMFLNRLVGMHRDHVPATSKGAAVGALSGSVYAGGRGLGLGIGSDESKLRERSRSYDRAWAKSSHLIRPKQPLLYSLSRGARSRDADDSVIEEEGDEPDDGDVPGWTEREPRREQDDTAEDGLWRDEGVVGLLQQVLGQRA
ncbi:hypothetical protein IAU60_003689 [Kwoniella sp. DSM 27419]